MTRVRIALLVLAVAVALPVAALVVRALDSLEAERQMRHQAVADRTFDEMERALSVWLEREESRPFSDYRFYTAKPATDGTATRSPLSRPPEEGHVIGAFQVDPDGSVHTPLAPRDLEAAEARGDWPPADRIQTRIERVRELAALLPEHARRLRALGYEVDEEGGETTTLLAEDASLSDGLMGSSRRGVPGDSARTDEDTVEEAKKDAALEQGGRGMRRPQLAEKEEAYSAYEVLESLNLASNQRAERRQKVRVEKRSDLPSSPAPARPPEAMKSLAPDADPGLGDSPSERSVARAQPATAASAAHDRFLDEEPVPVSSASERPLVAAPVPETIRIAIDPMTGVSLPSEPTALALYRTVIVEAQGYRQGLLLDLDALGAMLESQVVRAGGLGALVAVQFGHSGTLTPSSDGPGHYSYVHRFAEPFDALSARLDLQPLDGPAGEESTLFVLVGLIIVLAVGGLLVVDRMTRVVVDFADRRSNFVAAVSHELKTPLTAIRMYAEMLRDGLVATDDKRNEYYATITDESERLTRLIDNVLEFSRLEKGRRELALVAGDPTAPLLEAVDHLKPHAEREGFELVVDVEGDLPPVLFERDALLQVVFNLVDNAIKYAATARRREIVLRLRNHEGGVELSVRDYGPGVASKNVNRVFAPFYRAENELTRSAKGTGIGLALVSGLASAMHARVVGENPDGGGFRVRLMLAPD